MTCFDPCLVKNPSCNFHFAYTYSVSTSWYSQIWLYCSYYCTSQYLMTRVKQPKSFKVRSIQHEYASECTLTPKGELFCKFCDCLARSDKRLIVRKYRRGAKHQRGSFHETESSQTSLKHAIPDFADSLFFVSFQQNKDFEPIGLISKFVYEHVLYSALQLKTQEIDRSKWSQHFS